MSTKTQFLVAFVALAFALPVRAAALFFGTPVNQAPACFTENLRSDCSRSISVGVPVAPDPAFTFPSGIIVRGQASANSVAGEATADTRILYDIPYSLRRSVSVTPSPSGAVASFERFELEFPALYAVQLGAKDDFLQVGGAQAARAFDATISSIGGFFSPLTLTGGSLSGDNSTFSLVGDGGTAGFIPALNASGPRRSEPGTDALGLPMDFRAWDDFLFPQATDYSQPFSFTQTLEDILRVSFRLRAHSTAQGLFSTNGGQAIACAGLGNSLPLPILDGVDDTDCELYGLFVGVEITNRGTYETVVTAAQVGTVSEPATLALFGMALAGLVFSRRRKLS